MIFGDRNIFAIDADLTAIYLRVSNAHKAKIPNPLDYLDDD